MDFCQQFISYCQAERRALAGCRPGAASTKLIREGCAVPTPITWREITTVFKGRVVGGSYAVEDGTVKVRAGDGEKATQLRGTNAIWAAGRLLRELAAEGKA
jgi:hypothetical protein